MSFETVRQSVKDALHKLRRQDAFLIDADTNERTISHKLAEYLQEKFPDRHVDCEYNRHGRDIKKLRNVNIPSDGVGWNELDAKTIFPDIIVHKRDTDTDNLLVIEIKKSSNTRNLQFDKDKLIALTQGDYQYRFGLFLSFSMNNKADFLEWYAVGEVFLEERISVQAN